MFFFASCLAEEMLKKTLFIHKNTIFIIKHTADTLLKGNLYFKRIIKISVSIHKLLVCVFWER